MECLFELCTPRTHGAPDSERDKKTQKNKHHIFAPTASARSAIFPKLCVVIELVVPIKKGAFIFRLDALAKALSVIATATWLGGWLGVRHTPVLYQNG